MEDGFDQEFWDSLLRGDHLDDNFLKHAAPSGKQPVPEEVLKRWREAAREAAESIRTTLDADPRFGDAPPPSPPPRGDGVGELAEEP